MMFDPTDPQFVAGALFGCGFTFCLYQIREWWQERHGNLEGKL